MRKVGFWLLVWKAVDGDMITGPEQRIGENKGRAT
jgi:hypothetical protein